MQVQWISNELPPCDIEECDVRTYSAHVARPRLRQTLLRLETVARHREILLGMDDAVATVGATKALWETLLDVMAIPPRSFAEHREKCRALVRLLPDAVQPAWLAEGMTSCAILMDWETLQVTPEQEASIRAMLPNRTVA